MQSEMGLGDEESIHKICTQVFETHTGITDHPHTRVAVEYLARTCVAVFDEHVQVEDQVYFDLLDQVVGLSTKEKKRWKPILFDGQGTRRRVVAENNCLAVRQNNGDLTPLLPLSIQARCQPKKAEKVRADYEMGKPRLRGNSFEHDVLTAPAPLPTEPVRRKGAVPRVKNAWDNK